MQIPILRLPYTNEEIAEVQSGIAEVLRSNILTKGPKVERLEQEWAKYCGVEYAVACTSGTAALEIIFRAIGVEGKSVVIPSNTFIATAVAAIRAGAKVILADCERETLQLSLKSAMDASREDTAAVCLVHIGGYITPQLCEFACWCDREGIALVEDAAHSHGAEFEGRKAGSLGTAGAFSFFPTKVMTCGEGGMITTDDEDLYDECMRIRNHCRKDDNPQVHYSLGYNWRMDEIRAVLALQQVRKADRILKERRKIAKWYDEKLAELHKKHGIILTSPRPPRCNPAFYKYIILTFHQQEIRQAMEQRGIQMPGLVYEVPLHRQPALREFLPHKAEWGNYVDTGRSLPSLRHVDALPNTDWVADHHLCLPLHLGITEEEVDYVVESLKEVLR